MGALAVVVAAGIEVMRRRLLLVDVVGDSMSPTYGHGDRLLVVRRRRFRVGDVVIAGHGGAPRDPAATEWLVKRLAALPGDATPAPVVDTVGGRSPVPAHSVVLLGDHAASVDSRVWGFVPLGDLAGVVLVRVRAAWPGGEGAPGNPDP